MRRLADAAFPASEYQRRLNAVRERMAHENLDVLVVSSPENICYVSGYDSVGYFAQQALLVAHDAEPVLVTRALEVPNAEASSIFDTIVGYRDHESGTTVIATALAELRAERRRIGVELRSRSLTNAQFGELAQRLPATYVDSFGIIEGVRLIKSELELSLIRAAGAIVERGMLTCIAAVRSGVSERELAATAYAAIINAGTEWTGAPPFVSSGERSARAHTTWSDRIIGPGDPVFLEVNASLRRYHAAQMRSVALPPISDRLRSMMDASVAGLEAALSAIRPGVTAADVDAVCRDAIARAGWADSFRLRSGYSIGLGFENFGEGALFSLHAENRAAIQTGMALHLVPYLSEPGFAGAAFSETVIVTAHGPELVASVARTLDSGCA